MAEAEAPRTEAIQLVQVAQQILTLPTDVLLEYARTGNLPEGAWIPGYRERLAALQGRTEAMASQEDDELSERFRQVTGNAS